MRLSGYDYSLPGYYFVTICTKNRQNVFGFVAYERMHLNVFGRAIRQCWFDLPKHYSCILDSFVVMPDHIHGIIVIPDEPLWRSRPGPVAAGL
ncbi:MAG: transposase, partial [Candidatus Kerfeldbacteria bacterium]|nr:transposase [Candidatus Kerfeldbacteria bacterium]